MARQKVIIALFGLVMGAAGMLFWLSPRLQKDQLAAALPSATWPLTIPFSRLLTTADPLEWVVFPHSQGHWQTAKSPPQFFPYRSPHLWSNLYRDRQSWSAGGKRVAFTQNNRLDIPG